MGYFLDHPIISIHECTYVYSLLSATSLMIATPLIPLSAANLLSLNGQGALALIGDMKIVK